MAVATIDYDAVFEEIKQRLSDDETRRLAKPEVLLFDGDWNLRGEVHNEIEASFQVKQNDVGRGVIVLPAKYYLAKWMTDHDSRAGHKNVFVVVNYNSTRWSGTLDELEKSKDANGQSTIIASFNHDYAHLNNIYGYSNPLTPPELQVPRVWIAFGPARWALKLTLLLNIMRIETSIWALPDDPLDVGGWIDSVTGMSNWSQAVMPLSFDDDPSMFAVVHSRFKSMHDLSNNIVSDAQLTWEPRRYLDGDPPPWPGANLKHGCLVWDLVDHSGFTEETSFFGNIFTGLVRAFTNLNSDGLNEGVSVIDDPAFPAEYSQPGFHGSLPQAPGIILRDGPRTGITSSSFKYNPATAVSVITGGHSMPGVNEAISAGIQMAGDMIAAMIGVPPIGGATDAILKPLYTDTVLAFQKIKDHIRAQDLGWSHFHETFEGDGGRAYTLAALVSIRAGMFRTRERTSHTVTVRDGCEGLRVGQFGRGNCYIGTRIGTTTNDWGKPGRVYVDQVSELVLSYSRTQSPAFTLTVGRPPDEDPVLKGLEMIKDVLGAVQELGVI